MVDETELDERLREVVEKLRATGARRTDLALALLTDAGTSLEAAQAVIDRGLATGALVLLGSDMLDAGFSGGPI
jgi:hypothetical protein